VSSPSHRISIYFSYRRALHSQECFLPSRGGFNLRCTRERDIPKNVFFLREEVLIYDAPSLPRKDNRFDQELPSIGGSKVWRKGSRSVAWLDGRKNVLFLRWRGERYILHRATGFPYISYILPCRLNSFTRSLKGLYTPHPRG